MWLVPISSIIKRAQRGYRVKNRRALDIFSLKCFWGNTWKTHVTRNRDLYYGALDMFTITTIGPWDPGARDALDFRHFWVHGALNWTLVTQCVQSSARLRIMLSAPCSDFALQQWRPCGCPRWPRLCGAGIWDGVPRLLAYWESLGVKYLLLWVWFQPGWAPIFFLLH